MKTSLAIGLVSMGAVCGLVQTQRGGGTDDKVPSRGQQSVDAQQAFRDAVTRLDTVTARLEKALLALRPPPPELDVVEVRGTNGNPVVVVQVKCLPMGYAFVDEWDQAPSRVHVLWIDAAGDLVGHGSKDVAASAWDTPGMRYEAELPSVPSGAVFADVHLEVWASKGTDYGRCPPAPGRFPIHTALVKEVKKDGSGKWTVTLEAQWMDLGAAELLLTAGKVGDPLPVYLTLVAGQAHSLQLLSLDSNPMISAKGKRTQVTVPLQLPPMAPAPASAPNGALVELMLPVRLGSGAIRVLNFRTEKVPLVLQ